MNFQESKMVAGTNKEIASSKFYLADQHSVRRTLSFKQETPVYFKLVTISKDDFFFFGSMQVAKEYKVQKQSVIAKIHHCSM